VAFLLFVARFDRCTVRVGVAGFRIGDGPPGPGRLLNATGAERGAVKSDQNIQKSEDVRR
jgi:hypothetical protein